MDKTPETCDRCGIGTENYVAHNGHVMCSDCCISFMEFELQTSPKDDFAKEFEDYLNESEDE